MQNFWETDLFVSQVPISQNDGTNYCKRVSTKIKQSFSPTASVYLEHLARGNWHLEIHELHEW